MKNCILMLIVFSFLLHCSNKNNPTSLSSEEAKYFASEVQNSGFRLVDKTAIDSFPDWQHNPFIQDVGVYIIIWIKMKQPIKNYNFKNIEIKTCNSYIAWYFDSTSIQQIINANDSSLFEFAFRVNKCGTTYPTGSYTFIHHNQVPWNSSDVPWFTINIFPRNNSTQPPTTIPACTSSFYSIPTFDSIKTISDSTFVTFTNTDTLAADFLMVCAEDTLDTISGTPTYYIQYIDSIPGPFLKGQYTIKFKDTLSSHGYVLELFSNVKGHLASYYEVFSGLRIQ